MVWCFLLLPLDVCAEKKIIYDEERGIIVIDTDHPEALPPKPAVKPAPARATTEPVDAPAQVRPAPRRTATAREDIHVGRAKDPSEVYFRSGLEYFKSRDYENALKNFTFADSIDPKPEYALWQGKTLRQMERFDKMLFVMRTILKTYPASDVADDALFETAFYAQSTNDYAGADSLYTRLAEQYPFGASYSNQQPFHEVARQQRAAMRDEMTGNLKALGFEADDLAAAIAAFQKANGLAPTGRGEPITVTAVKAALQGLLDKQNQTERFTNTLRRYASVGIAVAAVLLLEIILLIVVFVSARGKARQLATLRQLIADLDPQKIRQG